MKIDVAAVRKTLKSFDFKTLFYEHLGWDKHQAHLDIPVDGTTVSLTAIAQKRGFVAFVCRSMLDRPTRLKIDHQVTKSVREHFVIYADEPTGQQVWHWVRREAGKPLASRDHRFDVSQSGDPLIQRLERIAVSLQEEEALTLPDIAGRNREAFDVDKVTKKFYERFKAEHAAFLKLINGFPPHVKVDGKLDPHPDLQWYTSLMLNRLMFVYFIQKKGFLDGDTDYLRNRLALVQQARGKDKFQSFYRYFLLRLFHDGLGKSPDERKFDPAMQKVLGKVPYLNGGFFEGHKLETDYPDIEISDQAFEQLFNFFDLYSWHLDERPCRADNEINPDVVGYIFEKYINQKQMGAYYTKEDITEYISKNTIIPYLFDAARKTCAIAFKPDSALWRLLSDDPDRYIYPAVGHGVTCDYDRINHRDHTRRAKPLPLPAEIEQGIKDVSKRGGWNKKAPEAYGLPTETWREVVARRQRCIELRETLSKSEVHEINDLITLNLDIWQFARDAIINAEGPELLRAFWHAIAGRIPEKSNEKIALGITILDPTCGSGAFLFAALRILETLYSDCLERMDRFLEDIADKPHHPKQFSDFIDILAKIGEHRGARPAGAEASACKYFILKSIIINNLFGVDIMEEAVEICKLRLFLKLVAQVETVDQIEPLPDIDFNIRAGNTLVGFSSLDKVKQSMDGDLFRLQSLPRIEEDAALVDRAFQQFRKQQTTHGGRVTAQDKQELLTRLAKLDAELDRYLAGEYGVDVKKQKEFAAWKASHQPFHWFVEFYGIMHTGGFDVIIGNPPYVEYSKVMPKYMGKDYATKSCDNLYAFVVERCLQIRRSETSIGIILPYSAFCTKRMAPLVGVITCNKNRDRWFSHFGWRPATLFSGVNIPLSILLLRTGRGRSFSTTFHKWYSDARETLFGSIEYVDCLEIASPAHIIPKIGNAIELRLVQKLQAKAHCLSHYTTLSGGKRMRIYYRNTGGLYWRIITDFRPTCRQDGEDRRSSTEAWVDIQPEAHGAAVAALNSNLFWFHYIVFGPFHHLNPDDILCFPIDIAQMSPSTREAVEMAGRAMMESLRQGSELRTRRHKGGNETVVQTFFPSRSKPYCDRIDRILALHYGLTEDEVDYVVNYDIRFRLQDDSSANDSGDETEE